VGLGKLSRRHSPQTAVLPRYRAAVVQASGLECHDQLRIGGNNMTDSGEFDETPLMQHEVTEGGSSSWPPVSVADQAAMGVSRPDQPDAGDDNTEFHDPDDEIGEEDEDPIGEDGDQDDEQEGGESMIERRRRTLHADGHVSTSAAWTLDPVAAAAWRHVQELLQDVCARRSTHTRGRTLMR
jgi:hypothetical protein